MTSKRLRVKAQLDLSGGLVEGRRDAKQDSIGYRDSVHGLGSFALGVEGLLGLGFRALV